MSIITEKKCSRCKKIKSIDNFNLNKNSSSGYTYQCKSCTRLNYIANKENILSRSKKNGKEYRENNKEKISKNRHKYYINHPDKVIERNREWRYKNPNKPIEYSRNRRAWTMEANGKISTKEWLSLCSFYGNKCLCCGATERLTLDHVIPLKLGGTHTIENAQPLCHSCNSKKGAKTIDYRN